MSNHLVIFPTQGPNSPSTDVCPPTETVAKLDNQVVRRKADASFVFDELSSKDRVALEKAGARILDNRPIRYVDPITPLDPPKSGGALDQSPISPKNRNTVPAHGADVLHKLGITGQDVNVVILDTGLGLHDELPAGRVVKFDNAFTPEEETPADRTDGHGHGTHVAGTAVGKNGMAPGANIMAIQVLTAKGTGSLESIRDGIDRAIQWKNETPGEPMVLNMSLGGTARTDPALDPIVQKVEEARRAGIIVVIAAGNEGEQGERTIGTPGIARGAITVGAVDVNGTPKDYSDDKLANFSSRGSSDPNASNGQGGKPNETANGKNVTSTLPDNRHATASGTSMATPAVAGGVALLLGYAKQLESKGELRNGKTVDQLVGDRAFERVLYWSSMNNESLPGHHEGAGMMRVDEAKKLFDKWYKENGGEEPPEAVEPDWVREGQDTGGDGGGSGGVLPSSCFIDSLGSLR